ncbi:MAG: prolyl oligopeptidase family serine peptidase [Clostridiales bacterium]|jgi:dienelactone hydrolase|nr:prolyl oligopeptidase family serine peptidase [Clostridiales bacterium]
MEKNTSPHAHNLAIMAATKPALAYDGGDFEAWQNKARAKLKELLGFDKFESCDPDFELESESQDENMYEYRFSFQSEEGYYSLCHFCVPKGKEGPIPLVVCLQGHSMGMHVSFNRAIFPGEEVGTSEVRGDFALQAIRNGYCALTVEQRNFGQRGGTAQGTNCYNSSLAALLMGRTTIGERAWDVMRALDMVFENFTQADPEKIGIMGNSGGGTTTFYTACLDERIKLAMPSCAVCTYEKSIAPIRHCSCNHVPHIREFFEMGDLTGLIAPRKLLIVAGDEDDIFPIDGVEESFEVAKKLYQAAGVPENCKLVVGQGGHRFYPNEAWPVFNQMF